MKVISFTQKGKRMLIPLSELISSVFPDYKQNGEPDDELVIITGDDYIDSTIPVLWHRIYQAWEDIRSARPGTGMRAWRVIRQYGEEIAPGFRVFRLKQKKCKKPTYFYLLSEKSFCEGFSRLTDLFCILSHWQHTKRGRCFFHAAGIIHRDSAYLFAGPSGSGKSTVCSLSTGCSFSIIHDDHVVVYPDGEGVYKVTNHHLSTPGVPVRAIFFLVKDTINRLVTRKQATVAKGLLDSSFEHMVHLVLHGQLLQDTFANCAAIARCIPGFDLHFTKSPDFWDGIDAEFRNQYHS
jgi:hypothetical protein